jgi:hypothetical protein
MDNFPCCKVVKRDIKKCLVELEMVDNVMQNPCSLFFLDKRNNLVVEEITERFRTPITLTTIKLEIIPSDLTKFYYSLTGLETILYNLFKSDNKLFQNDLKKGRVYLKTYYKRDNFYTIPVLCMDVIFFRKLHRKTIENLRRILKTDLIHFTGNIGDIEIKNISSNSEFKDYLKIPLLVGQPEFKKEGLLKQKYFRDEQIVEMNYIHGISLIKLTMKEVINNNFISIFDEIRDCISSSETPNNEVDEETKDIIDYIFSKDYDNDLPF